VGATTAVGGVADFEGVSVVYAINTSVHFQFQSEGLLPADYTVVFPPCSAGEYINTDLNEEVGMCANCGQPRYYCPTEVLGAFLMHH